MKKALLFFGFLPLFVCGQTPSGELSLPAPKHEIGINLFSVTRLSSLPWRPWYENPDFNFVPGLYYKRHFGQNALRGSFDFSQHRLRRGDSSPAIYGADYYSTVRRNFTVSLGYERSFGTHKFQPYIFSDLYFMHEKETGERFYWGEFGLNGLRPISMNTSEFGLAGGMGFRYKITPKLSLSYEFAVQGYYSKVKEQSIYHDNRVDTYYRGGFHVNPVSKLGFAILF
jgi:hypothetical protein